MPSQSKRTVSLYSMLKEVSYSHARANLAALCGAVTSSREPVLVRRRGAAAVALVAADELEGLLETAHLLRSPANASRLLRALRRARRGKGSRYPVQSLRRRFDLEREKSRR